jgi:hypothetical protein
MRYLKPFELILFSILFASPSYGQESDAKISPTINTSWASNYVSEGRDNLEKGGFLTIEPSIDIANISLSIFLGMGASSDYQELNFVSSYHSEIADFEYSAGYTRLEFIHNGTFDNELSAAVSYAKYSWLIPTIDYRYSTQSDGSFIELSLQSNFSTLDNKLILSPYVMENIDLGYATKKHNGLNNIQFGLKALYYLSEKIEINAHITQSLAQKDVKENNGKNILWGDVSFSWTL